MGARPIDYPPPSPFDPALALYCSTEGCGVMIGYGGHGAKKGVCNRCATERGRASSRVPGGYGPRK